MEPLSPAVFRSVAERELQNQEHLGGWLERWIRKSPVDAWQPWSRNGREYVDYYNTLHQVLRWYKLDKVSRLRPMGWEPEAQTIERVKGKIGNLLQTALQDESSTGQHDEFFRNYDAQPLARYTALDYLVQRSTNRKIRNVLDFGSGIGRQSFAWQPSDATLFSIDAIETLYVLQNNIYHRVFPRRRLVEYFESPEDVRTASWGSGDIVHLPTWQLPALPAKSMDLMICVQVLQELNAPTLEFALDEFTRLASDNALLYIRDNEYWAPNHYVSVGRELLKRGWELTLKTGFREGSDIEGTPRLWVYTGIDNGYRFRLLRRLKRTFVPSWPGHLRSWRNFGLPL